MTDPPSDTQRFFETFRLFEEQRTETDRLQLLAALATSLGEAGYLRLVNATTKPATQNLAGLFVPVLFWGLGAAAGSALGMSWPFWMALAVGLFVSYGVLVSLAPRTGDWGAGLLTTAWVVGAIGLGITDAHQLIWAYAIPIAAAVTLGFALRSLVFREARDVAIALAGVGRSAPYVAPVVIVAILLPALTADVWQLASAVAPTSLVWAAAVSVGLLLFLVARQLQRELEPAFVARCRSLTSRATAPESTRAAVMESVDKDTAQVVQELPAEILVGSWPRSGTEYAPYLVAVEGDTLRRPLNARLLVTVGAIGSLLTAYIYVLLAVIVPTRVAARWSDEPVDSHHLSLWGSGVSLPGGSYIAMAVLLGIFATAIFLAFALTEERIATAITEALLREPIDRFLLLALPFVSSLEWVLENQERLGSMEGDESGSEPGSSAPDESEIGDVSR